MSQLGTMPKQEILELRELQLPQTDFTDGTPPTEVTRFFRGIWVANALVAGDETPSEVLPFNGQNGLQPKGDSPTMQDLTLPATDTQQAAWLDYEQRSSTSMHCSMEMHRLSVPASRAGIMIPYLIAWCEIGSPVDSREPIDVLRMKHRDLGPAVVRYHRDSGAVLDRDAVELPLVNQIMRTTQAFLAGREFAVKKSPASH